MSAVNKLNGLCGTRIMGDSAGEIRAALGRFVEPAEPANSEQNRKPN